VTPPASRVSVGGDCIIIIIGVLTRFFAAALAIEMLMIFSSCSCRKAMRPATAMNTP